MLKLYQKIFFRLEKFIRYKMYIKILVYIYILLKLVAIFFFF